MIQFIEVSKLYPKKTALENINLEIEEGEFTFLIGSSGSGKTTLIKLLIKQEDVSKGNIFFYDTDITRLNPSKVTRLRREISVVFQDFKLLPHKNLYENIAFILEVSGKSKKDIEQTVPYCLKLVNLENRYDAFPDEISGGEKQRIAIARAIANNPKVLIADEPTGNLDPKSSWEIIELLQKINEWGTTVIMATHGSEFVDKLGKRVIHIENGKIIQDTKKGTYSGKPVKNIPEIEKIEINEDIIKTDNKNEDQIDELKVEIEDQPEEEEKQIDITFTTKKTKKETTKNKSTKKKKGKDVVDISKLKLSEKIENVLIMNDLNTIAKLSKSDSKKLSKIKELSEADIDKILKKLEKLNKK